MSEGHRWLDREALAHHISARLPGPSPSLRQGPRWNVREFGLLGRLTAPTMKRPLKNHAAKAPVAWGAVR